MLVWSTCFKSGKGSRTNFLLTKKPNRFQKTYKFVNRVSDCHKVTVKILSASFKKLLPQYISFRTYKAFNQNASKHDFDKICSDPYEKLLVFNEI